MYHQLKLKLLKPQYLVEMPDVVQCPPLHVLVTGVQLHDDTMPSIFSSFVSRSFPPNNRNSDERCQERQNQHLLVLS